MNKLIHIGFGNMVNTSKIIAIVSPDSAPVKRMVQNAKEKGIAIDATQGRKTKAVLVMENSQIVLSALLPETITGRAMAEPEAAGGKPQAGDDALNAGKPQAGVGTERMLQGEDNDEA